MQRSREAMFAIVIFNMSSASGGVRPQTHRGFARGPRCRGTSVPQTRWFCVCPQWNITVFTRATLCYHGISHGPVSVRLSLRPLQVGVFS